jgi:hypothetical protein
MSNCAEQFHGTQRCEEWTEDFTHYFGVPSLQFLSNDLTNGRSVSHITSGCFRSKFLYSNVKN